MKKENRGGPRQGAGRPKVNPKDKRVNINARVNPETKKKAFNAVKERKKVDKKFSLGKYLDEIIE